MVKVVVDELKDYYAEVKKLIQFHYENMPDKGFNYEAHSFSSRYPSVYQLFLRIAALGLDK